MENQKSKISVMLHAVALSLSLALACSVMFGFALSTTLDSLYQEYAGLKNELRLNKEYTQNLEFAIKEIEMQNLKTERITTLLMDSKEVLDTANLKAYLEKLTPEKIGDLKQGNIDEIKYKYTNRLYSSKNRVLAEEFFKTLSELKKEKLKPHK